MLLDLSEASQFFQLESNMNSTATQNLYEKYLTGNADRTTRRAWAAGGAAREYVCTINPIGAILNTAALLPLSRLSDVHVEFWLSSSAQCLDSPLTHTGATYALSDIEILADYVRSRSISAYFNASPVRFHVQDFSHRFANVTSQQNLIRLSSAHTSLNKTITVLRDPTNLVIQTIDKFNSFYTGASVSDLNVFINNQLYFEENCDSKEEMYHQLVKACPAVKTSDWFTTLYATTRHVIAVNLTAAPVEFAKALSSGVKTSALNSDVVVRVNLAGVPPALRADTYLVSDALIFVDGPRGDLKVAF